ncbi:helicase HerA domain-containing protein [Glycomyces xiaoerkulensis]|uniref:helicase HerA domain-containing protein n=1 Tax=Glycomyces xiaoerkulensis TaxID=2038139 RepID=UPI000C2609CF|nr:DUF87 domain-containing protein [Glycomyces xiaoerkulensis]
MISALEALRSVPSDFAVTPDDIWDDRSRPHVNGINEPALRAIEARIAAAENSPRSSVTGLPLVGEGGSGKSHLLGRARRDVQDRGGFFVRLNIVDVRDFWANLAGSFVYALDMPHRSAESGLAHLLERLADLADLPEGLRHRLLESRLPDPDSVAQFTESVRGIDRSLAGTRNTLRALLLLHSNDERRAAPADAYLAGGEFDVESLPGFGTAPPRSPIELVRDLSQLMALCGATVIAVDQVDDIVRSSQRTAAAEGAESTVELLDMLGSGLTELRDVTRRSTVLLSCLDTTWSEFTRATVDTVLQRFESKIWLDNTLPDPKVAAALLEAVLEPVYRRSGFEPPYPSYPFGDAALGKAALLSPRDLLRSASAHLNRCVELGEVTEATELVAPDQKEGRPQAASPAPGEGLDADFENYRAMADIDTARSPDTVDTRMPQLLDAALRSFQVESGRDPAASQVGLPVGKRQAFHAELHDEDAEPRRSWSFLAISKTNPNAVQHRVAGLSARAGIGRSNRLHRSRAVLWVTAPSGEWGSWGRNTKAAKTLAEFEREGTVIMVTEDDLRVFAALHHLHRQRRPGLEAWLRARRPASRTVLFQHVFGPPPEESAPPEPEPVRPDLPPSGAGRILDFPLSGPRTRPEAGGRAAAPRTGTGGQASSESVRLPVGRGADGEPVRLDTGSMPKHTGVFAGSGSGKTVLLRRIIEAAALQGVPAIVLDPNNDLSRLGSAWPEPPEHWLPGDEAAAAQYMSSVEVTVWTPGRTGGRPLSFRPLPDFAAVADDPDEMEIAVDTAVASLVPRARIARAASKDDHARAVLREALAFYARGGASDLGGFLDFLDELPEGVSTLPKAEEIAAKVAATLRAAMINDRVFGGTGEPLDPAVLLRPSPGKRTRVSVVNFLGLPTEEQRQGFVNQLELALFSWAKRNPAVDRPLSALFVIDEAQTIAPSSGSTVCLDSTLALVSQARKYGLGMVFATQAPKGIHNRIVGNCATHWYGRINSPSQISAATQVAENKGGSTVDLAHLRAGQFYLAADGKATERVDVPMCLSHHPPTAPTAEEILASVRASD